MPVSEKTYLRLALEDPNQWELHCGSLERKPGMSAEHNRVAMLLSLQIGPQLDWRHWEVRLGMGHLRRSAEGYYIPDVYVVPAELVRPQRPMHRLEVYSVPLPLVVEIWSPSTGDYDVDSKLPEYQRRGDLEIWRIHPYDRILTAWQRQPGGTYTESLYRGGKIQPVALPNVTVDFDALFE